MSKDSDNVYIPLDTIEASTSHDDDIIEVTEENDEELLIPKNNVAQIEIAEDDDEHGHVLGEGVNNDQNNAASTSAASTSETLQNPFLPSASNTDTAQPDSLKNKLKKSFLSEFRFFRKKPKVKKPYVIHSHDGVFSNLNEKPEIRSDALPTYTQVTGEAEYDPFMGYEVAYCHIGEFYGEMLIDNIPAGTWAGLVLSAFFSCIFDFVGFIMTFFLSTSHGTRKGALFGLGITLIRYGLIIITGDNLGATDDELEDNGMAGLSELWWYGPWVGFVMIALAVLIMYQSIVRFKRVLKVKAYADAHPERVPEINL